MNGSSCRVGFGGGSISGCARARRRWSCRPGRSRRLGDDARHVGVVREVVRRRRPACQRAAGARRAPSRREAQRGQRERGDGDGPGAVRRQVMNRRRVTVSPSNAPGHAAVERCTCSSALSRPSAIGRRTISPPGRGAVHGAAVRALAPRRSAAARRSPAARLGGLELRVRAMPTAATPAARRAARSASPSAWAWRSERDDVGELGDGLEVAELGEPGQPQRVEPVARQQREVRILRAHHAPGGVVLQVALADRLDEQRIFALAARGAGPGGGRGAEGAVRRTAAGVDGRRPAGRRRPPPPRRARRAAGHRRSPRTRRPPPRRVRSTCSARVRERREPGLELGRRRIDAARQQRPAPGAVGLEVAGRCAGVVAHRRGG